MGGTKLLILQRKIIRAISWADRSAHATFFLCLGLMRLTDFNEYHNVCIMFQVVNGLNTRLCELVPISYLQHKYSTGNTDHMEKKEDLFAEDHRFGTDSMQVLK